MTNPTRYWNASERFLRYTVSLIFRNMPIPGTSLKSHVDLSTIYLQLVAEHNSPKIIQRYGEQPLFNKLQNPSLYVIDGLQDLALSDVEVAKEIIPRRVFKVLAAGREYCCKMSDCDLTSFQREMQLLKKLSSLNGPKNRLRVPMLEGTVGCKEGIPGMLLEFISHKSSLAEIDVGQVPYNLRCKWAQQIRTTVQVLHNNGTPWGDVKAGNVLIDAQDDA